MHWQSPVLHGQPPQRYGASLQCAAVLQSVALHVLQGHTLIDLTAGGTECNGGNLGGNEIIFLGSTSPNPRTASRWAQQRDLERLCSIGNMLQLA